MVARRLWETARLCVRTTVSCPIYICPGRRRMRRHLNSVILVNPPTIYGTIKHTLSGQTRIRDWWKIGKIFLNFWYYDIVKFDFISFFKMISIIRIIITMIWFVSERYMDQDKFSFRNLDEILRASLKFCFRVK